MCDLCGRVGLACAAGCTQKITTCMQRCCAVDGESGSADFNANPAQKGTVHVFRVKGDRKCTDVGCLVIFIFYWIGMVIVTVYSFAYGDYKALLYGRDFEGRMCGVEGTFTDETNNSLQTFDFRDKPYLYYPNMHERECGGLRSFASLLLPSSRL